MTFQTLEKKTENTMRYTISTDLYDEICGILQDSKTPFSAVVSRNRRVVKTEKDEYIFSDSDIPMRDLSVIKQAKAEMINGGLSLSRVIQPWDVEFFKVGIQNAFPIVSYDVVEIDISKAYWCAALKLGFISKQTYEKGLKIEKVSRLAAVGASAVVKWRFTFDGSDFSEVSEDYDISGRNAFFHVCAEVSRAISLAAGDFAHLTWVDAIFCYSRDADAVCESLDQSGYQYKRKDIIWAWYKPGHEKTELSYLEKMEQSEKVCRVRVKTFKFVRKKDKSFQKRAEKSHLENLEKHF